MGKGVTRGLLCGVLGLVAFAVPVVASAQSTTTGTTTSSNGSSTGVGNAGSFGIGSGTSDSISTSTATSNGYQYSGTDNSVDSSMTIKVISEQELQSSNANTYITVDGTNGGTAGSFATGSNSTSGTSFSNFSGVLNNGWNTAPAATAQAATNIAVNGNFGKN